VHIFTPGNRRLVCECRPVSRLIRDLPLVYWLYPCDQFPQKREIRSSLLQLICIVADWQFSLEDLNAVIASCIAAQDQEYSRDLLFLLRVILHTGNAHLQRFLGDCPFTVFVPLTHLLGNTDPDVVFAVIDTYLVLHDERPQTAPTLPHHIEILTAFLAPRAFPETLVAKLTECALSHPEILALACFVVAEAGGDAVDVLTHTLTPSPIFCVDERWVLWPLIVAVKFPTATEFMLRFIVASSGGQWALIC
jgi:hypothetical protein